MKFIIRHEIRGRIRIHLSRNRLTCREADLLQLSFEAWETISSVKIYERRADVVLTYTGSRKELLQALCLYRFDKELAEKSIGTATKPAGRDLNRQYQEKLITQVAVHFGKKLFLPAPLCAAISVVKAIPYAIKGIQTLLAGKIEVPVLDALAIGASIARSDFATAGSVMFLLGIGETLEEWTHKRSVEDLARSMSLNTSKVWLQCNGEEVLTSVSEIHAGDVIVVRTGTVIPFDGKVAKGEALINEASLTGESLPVRKAQAGSVFAGTVVEEGELYIRVETTGKNSRYEKIITMIEESERLKSGLESKAEHLADALVPYTLAGSALTWFFTGNVTKAVSVLMVDFSCALKLAMPLSVLSAIREANLHGITVKGGRFLEAMAEADTIVFDKTGTLTKAQPTVVEVVSFNGDTPKELLRIAACMEEHFPHSMAKAVVKAAESRGLTHEEKHSTVSYIVAHGISTMVDEKKMVLGSHHFVFEDEGCKVPEGKQALFAALPSEYSQLYLAIEKELAAVILIEDPIRKEARAVLSGLKQAGFGKIVMMTGDSERTAAAVAKKVGVDAYASEVLPEDKARFVEEEKAAGRRVVMIGDGINDSPALSAADVGIAIQDGAELAREIADITISGEELHALLTLKTLSNALTGRIRKNYREIVGVNTGLIALGVLGILPPTTSALLHNTSTLWIGVNSMKNLLADTEPSL